MQKRHILLKLWAGVVIGLGSLSSQAQAIITPSTLNDFLVDPVTPTLNDKVQQAYVRFLRDIPVGNDFAKKAVALLVFPEIKKAGLIVGGSKGKGLLLRPGFAPVVYSLQGASVGWQAGYESRSQVYAFMTPQALNTFVTKPEQWNVGVDASLAVVAAGIADTLADNDISQQVVVFTFGANGLMLNVTFEGQIIRKGE